jgi:hypothetical protein
MRVGVELPQTQRNSFFKSVAANFERSQLARVRRCDCPAPVHTNALSASNPRSASNGMRVAYAQQEDNLEALYKPDKHTQSVVSSTVFCSQTHSERLVSLATRWRCAPL